MTTGADATASAMADAMPGWVRTADQDHAGGDGFDEPAGDGFADAAQSAGDQVDAVRAQAARAAGFQMHRREGLGPASAVG